MTPIDMVLYCPSCGMQHIDEPDRTQATRGEHGYIEWTNPPHRSHLCHGCGHIWRPADVPTNGVKAIKTHGKNDSPPPEPWAGWVDWNGRTCPVAADVIVDIKRRDGSIVMGAIAGHVRRWHHTGQNFDVVAYRYRVTKGE